MTEQDVGTEDIRSRAEKFQKIVDDCLADGTSHNVFLGKLQGAGATIEEAINYVQEFLSHQGEETSNEEHTAQAATSELDDRPDIFPEQMVSNTAWQVLRAKLAHVTSKATTRRINLSLMLLLDLLKGGISSIFQEISSAVLDAAPHLHNLTTGSIHDPHLDET